MRASQEVFFCVIGYLQRQMRRGKLRCCFWSVSVTIELVTFGGLHILDDEGELDWLAGQRSRAALLVYLAIERRVSREALITLFWPESDAENARHALRQSLYQLKRAVKTDWIESRAHELVVTDDVRTDVRDFLGAVERKDLESAADLYRGPFLDGVHLVDLSQWENWVDNRRAQYARAFRKASRDLIESKTATRDLTGAIDVAERWSARDPMDDEAQHRLIEALANAGERIEAVRQYETFLRVRESDDLGIPDETRALGERLRLDGASVPTLRVAPESLTDEGIKSSQRAVPRESRSLQRGIVAAIALLVLFSGLWGLRSKRNKPSAGSSATAIAVLPFSVQGGEAVEYLSEGIVTLLSAAFDGAGSIRPTDARATFAATAESGDSVRSTAYADKLADRLGAGMFVLGDVIEAGGNLQIQAAIYRRGFTEPQTKAVVTGSVDSVFPLVDRLAAQLLAGLSDPSADRLLRTASVTTASLPAFKSYLQGDRLMRAGQFERAADSYLAAIAHDSTFALAYYRLGLAREWAPLLGVAGAADSAAQFAARLSRRDRDLLEAFRLWRAGRAVEAERAYRAILTRYPDDVDAWFQLGEIQFHHGPLLGHPIGDSEEAWRKVLSAEPRNLFAITHLARIAAITGRVASVDSLLASFSPSQLQTDRRLTELMTLRAVARADTGTSRALAGTMRKWDGLSAWRVALFVSAFSDRPTAMSAIVRDMVSESMTPGLRADVEWFVSQLHLSGGQLSAAQRARAKAIASEQVIAPPKRRDGFDETIEWLAATLPLPYADTTLMRMRRSVSTQPISSRANAAFLVDTELGRPIQLEPLREYTIGVLSYRLRDKASLGAAATKLQDLAASRDATSLTRDLDRGLRARLAWMNGNTAEALRLLQALETSDSQGDVDVTPFASRAHERFLRGELLASLGRNEEALQWFGSLGYGSVSEIPFRAPSHLRQAEIYERLGKHDEATRHYSEFVKLWSNADANLQPSVDSARQRISILARSQ